MRLIDLMSLAVRLPPEVPVFLAQGTIDQIIRLDVTKNYMSKLCKTDSKVMMRILPNVGPALSTQVQWLS